jgi:uncharacterized membrane protein YfcA
VLAALFLAALFAFGASAISGGGASLLLVPLLGQVLSVASVPAALSIGTGTSSVSRLVVFRSDIRWDVTAWFVPAALPMAVAGAVALRFINPAYVQLLMAAFLLANLPRLMRPVAGPERAAVSRRAIVAVGGIAGFLSGLTGAVGVLFNRFYLSQGMTKQEIVATRATNEVLIHATKLVVYVQLGLMSRDALSAGLVVGAAAATSSALLKPALRRVSHAAFVKIGYAAMLVSGVALAAGAVTRVAAQERMGLDLQPVLSGVEARVRWRDSSLSLEMEWDGGVEVELSVDPSALSPELRHVVATHNPGGLDVLVESVYSTEGHYFEAYYLRDGQVEEKLELDDRGRILPDDD